MKKYGRAILFPGIACLILLYVFLQQDSSDEEEVLPITTISQEQTQEVNSNAAAEQIEKPIVEKIMVDVKGAVQLPGVYELTTEERIIDAIEMAGGYTKDAQSSVVNHAQKLQDEMVIYIPRMDEEMEQNFTNGQVVASPATSTDSSSEKVDLNSADEAALTTIPGIGPTKAQAIIAYREENGSFQIIEDLKNVSGIGDKTFEKLKEYIVVK